MNVLTNEKYINPMVSYRMIRFSMFTAHKFGFMDSVFALNSINAQKRVRRHFIRDQLQQFMPQNFQTQ